MRTPKGFVSIWLGILLLIAGCNSNKLVKVKDSSSENDWPRSYAVGQLSGKAADLEIEALEKAIQSKPGIKLTDADQAWLILEGRVDHSIIDRPGEEVVRSVKDIGPVEPVVVKDPFVHRDFEITKAPSVLVAEQVPYVLRQAQMTLTFTLKTPTGNPAGNFRTVTVGSKIKYGGIEGRNVKGLGIGDLPTEQETLTVLAGQLAAKAVSEIYLPEVETTLVLDGGHGFRGEQEVIKGIEAAHQGQWQEAALIWEGILKDDPKNPAAHYNLGVHFERQMAVEDLKKAQTHYAEAAREGNNPLYRTALTRIILALKAFPDSEPEQG